MPYDCHTALYPCLPLHDKSPPSQRSKESAIVIIIIIAIHISSSLLFLVATVHIRQALSTLLLSSSSVIISYESYPPTFTTPPHPTRSPPISPNKEPYSHKYTHFRELPTPHRTHIPQHTLLRIRNHTIPTQFRHLKHSFQRLSTRFLYLWSIPALLR